MKRLYYILCIALSTLALSIAAYSSSAGTEEDPLVSKSYVDKQLNALRSEIIGGTGQTTVVTKADGGFTTVNVPMGKILEGQEGTEIILRSGKGTVFLKGSEGIADTTTGQNLPLGAAVQANHLLVVPRSDGRGIIVSQDTWFLVKGSYTIR